MITPLSFVEPLENRIAPATIVSSTVVTFQDVDGDDVTIKVSKPIFTDTGVAAAIVTFAVSAVGEVDATSRVTAFSFGTVKVGGSIVVGTGPSIQAGVIFVFADSFGSIKVGGSLRGQEESFGAQYANGSITQGSDTDFNATVAKIGKLIITGSVLGATGDFTVRTL